MGSKRTAFTGSVGLLGIALAAACGSSDDAGTGDADAGAGDAGHIDPVYGEPDAGVLLGGGGGSGDDDGGTSGGDGGSSSTHGLVINEVDYDNVGTDNREFVEIYNAGASTADLGAIVLVLVDANAEYGRVPLSGTLAPGAYLVVADPAVVLATDAGVARVALPATSNALRNTTAGVGLLDTTSGTLVDALSYAGSVTAATVTGVSSPLRFVEGTATSAVDSNSAQGALARIPNGKDTNDAAADWAASSTPTPGSSNAP